ncbi:MAG TPA: hypothetical protein VLE53_16805 [Gemmatimonadaceae bacterium]|nr:hypothetical protein [Gemmatimonadaceae bacterium]
MAFILLAVIVAFMAITVGTVVATRVVSQTLSQNGLTRAREDSEMNVRLTRIEEAIDAMAAQIERLSEQQRALLEPRDS